MRYFFFSYTAAQTEGTIHGNIYLSADGFPSNQTIKGEVVKMHPKIKPESVVIMSMFEFKNEADFCEFRKKF